MLGVLEDSWFPKEIIRRVHRAVWADKAWPLWVRLDACKTLWAYRMSI
jgi:hypothetical protein